MCILSPWKVHIHIYIQALNYQLWKVIIKDLHTPIIKVDGNDIPKFEEDWDELDMKLIKLNAKAMNVLYWILDSNKFTRISTCISVKKV